MRFAVKASPEHPVLVDRFLADAIEVDVDAICDGERVVVGRDHGAHRGGRRPLRRQRLLASAVLALQGSVIDEILATPEARPGARRARAHERAVRGEGTELFVIEVNPRASRTVPFVSKAIGRPLAKLAALVMAGKTLGRAGLHRGDLAAEHFSVKEAVFPFVKFPGVDTLLGPEMKSTGEVMGMSIRLRGDGDRGNRRRR